jgi:hypothetical protein
MAGRRARHRLVAVADYHHRASVTPVGRCSASNKVRFRDKLEATRALHVTVTIRRRIEDGGGVSQRQECRAYACPSCRGWHLTSRARRFAAPAEVPS